MALKPHNLEIPGLAQVRHLRRLDGQDCAGLVGLSEDYPFKTHADCSSVYQLRGWATGTPLAKTQNCLQYTTSEDGTASVLILTRSDGQSAPKWQDIENTRDGRERLGYNPAIERKAIAQEDLEAVRAKAEFTSDADLMRLRLPVKGGDRAALARL